MASAESSTPEGQVTKIADLRPNMKNINLTFVVLEKFPGTSKTKEGNVIHSLLVADASGCIQSSMFDTYGERLQAGDIARLKNGWVPHACFQGLFAKCCMQNAVCRRCILLCD
jgi:ssDNA-binding replication factor A large subunit